VYKSVLLSPQASTPMVKITANKCPGANEARKRLSIKKPLNHSYCFYTFHEPNTPTNAYPPLPDRTMLF